MDLISIIVPVYNVEKYLERCLNSLIDQTYKKIEIIVVNDGSPDNSQSIIDRFYKENPTIIKPYKKENGGLSSARNLGITKAKGKYLLFVDSDDYVDKNYVKELYDSIKKTDSDVAICDIVDEYENENREERYYNYKPEALVSLENDKRQLLNRPAAWNKMYSKKIFDDNSFKFAEGKIYEDISLIPRIFLKAKKISYVDEPLYHYIIRNSSIMTASNIKKNLDILSAFDDIIEYYKKENLFKEYDEEIEYLAVEHILVAAVVRVIGMSKTAEIKRQIKPFIDYIETNFPNYMDNKYIKNLSKKRQLALYLINKKMYRTLKLLLKLRG